MTKLEDLIKFAEENPKLVQIRTDDKGFKTFKYTRKAFFDGLKQPELENLRGLVVDKNNELVTLPFPKMYNYGVEEQAPEIGLAEIVVAFKKINGFMCAISYYEGELIVSTTGTTDSKYAEFARHILRKDLPHIKRVIERHEEKSMYYKGSYTLLFEIVHSDDPHIIQENVGAYFIGIRYNRFDRLWAFDMYKEASYVDTFTTLGRYFYTATEIHPPKFKHYTFSDLLEEVAKVKHEGFVIYAEDNKYTKIKSPYYLFFKYMARTKSLHDWKNKVNNIFSNHKNEEFKQSIIEYMSNLNMRDFLELPEQDRLKELRKYSFAGLEG